MNEEIRMFVQPQIVSVGEDFYDENLYYIVIEGFTFCSIEGNCILDAIFALLAAFYVFNINYTCCKGVLSLLEETLFDHPRREGQLTVASFINAVLN